MQRDACPRHPGRQAPHHGYRDAQHRQRRRLGARGGVSIFLSRILRETGLSAWHQHHFLPDDPLTCGRAAFTTNEHEWTRIFSLDSCPFVSIRGSITWVAAWPRWVHSWLGSFVVGWDRFASIRRKTVGGKRWKPSLTHRRLNNNWSSKSSP